MAFRIIGFAIDVAQCC